MISFVKIGVVGFWGRGRGWGGIGDFGRIFVGRIFGYVFLRGICIRYVFSKGEREK